MRIAVVGDVMLDATIECESRENLELADVCLTGTEFVYDPGGAANVACLLGSMATKVDLYGAVGDDHNGRILNFIIDNANATLRPCMDITTLKIRTRRPGERRTQVRIDRERPGLHGPPPLPDDLSSYGAIVLADYGKGVFFGDEAKELIASAACPVICSPYPTGRHDIWEGATVAVMNEHEWPTIGDVGAEWTVVTRGPQGADIYEGDTPHSHVGGIRAVSDPQRVGAGDAVVARMALCLADGVATVPDAAIDAVNYATHYVQRRRGE